MTTRIKLAGGNGTDLFREVRAQRSKTQIPSLVLLLLILLPTSACVGSKGVPAYYWYSVRADFEVAGKPVSVGGVVECERRAPDFFPFNVGSGPGTPFKVRSKTFATKLDTGGVLLISPPVACASWRAGFKDDFPGGWYPLVYWLDDPETPQRGEVYFAETYYRQPEARVRFLGFEARSLGTGAFWFLRPEGYRSPWRLFAEVPWLEKRQPATLRGYIATIVDEVVWGDVPGLREALAPYRELTHITQDSEIRANMVKADALSEFLWPGIQGRPVFASEYRGRRVSAPGNGCRIKRPDLPEICSGLKRTYGMEPDPDSFGATLSSTKLHPGVAYLVPGQQKGTKAYTYEFTLFSESFEGLLGDYGLSKLDLFSPSTGNLVRISAITLTPPKGIVVTGDQVLF